MMTHAVEQGYFTKEDAKTYTRLSPRTLEYAVAEGKLRAFKVGKRVLFAKENLDYFIRQRQAGADLERLVDETVNEVLGK
jgi:excisionase family DNA binding protein